MKKLIILTLFSISFFFSCEEPAVVFGGPQPQDLTPITAIDMIYRGTFICESDSSLVHVHGRTIFKEKAFKFSLTPEEIETTEGLDLLGEQLILADWPEPLPAEITDSLVYSSIVLKDTLFHMGAEQVLKAYKGHMVLNKKLNDEKWEVMILSLDYDMDLRLSKAELPDDFDRLNMLTPVKDISTEDKVQYLIAPTVMEFDEILRRNLIFQECDLFTRTNGKLQI